MSKGKFHRVGQFYISLDGERAVDPAPFGFACYTKDFPSLPPWPEFDRFTRMFNVGSPEDAEEFLAGRIPRGEIFVLNF